VAKTVSFLNLTCLKPANQGETCPTYSVPAQEKTRKKVGVSENEDAWVSMRKADVCHSAKSANLWLQGRKSAYLERNG